jgi:glycerol kinase
MTHAAALIALDAGTTGVTALLYDRALTPLARAYREFSQHFPAPGWVEHDAGELLAAVDLVLAEVLAHPASAGAVALGITNQRETVFALERVSGRPLARGIVWQDRRTAQRCEALRAAGAEALVRERTGLLLDPYFSATKIEWLLGHVHGLREREARGEIVFATVDALIVAHLGGRGLVASDPTNASRTLLYDIERQRYDPELCALFGVSPASLPEVRPSAGDFGRLSRPYAAGRNLPIRAVVGDQQAALLGQGGHGLGGFKITYGTGCFLMLNAGQRRPAASPGLLTTLALDARGAPCFALEGSLFMGGAVVQWLRDGLGLIASADESEALARSVPDSAGVVLVPAFTGLGAPYWDPDARGALLGLTRGTTRAHVVRAGLEGIAFQNAELIELLRQGTGLPLDRIRVDGGAARNDLLMELQADLSGATLERSRDVEATARGAALLAGLAAGLWSDLGGLPEPASERFEPRPGAPERARELARWRRAVARVRSEPAPGGYSAGAPPAERERGGPAAP